jgi:hypothetical protein
MPIDTEPAEAARLIVKGDLDGLKAWLGAGGDLNCRLDDGETLLHKASYNGRTDIIGYLVGRGIPVNIADVKQFIPLHEAARNSQLDAVRCLLALGADTEAKNYRGKRPDEAAAGRDAGRIATEIATARKSPRWCRIGPDEIAHVSDMPYVGYRLTEVFNFAKETYLAVARNQGAGSEAAVLRTFDELRGSALLEDAEESFVKLGGVLPERGGKSLDKIKPAKRGGA